QIDLYLAQCFHQIDDPDRQLAAFQRALKGEHVRVPVGVWLDYARLLLERHRQSAVDDWTDVEKALENAEQAQTGTAGASLLRAEMLHLRGKTKDAQALLEKSRKAQSNPTSMLVALATQADHQGDSSRALTLLKEAQAKSGLSVDVRLGWARYWSKRRT